jgi:hypothetical protein
MQSSTCSPGVDNGRRCRKTCHRKARRMLWDWTERWSASTTHSMLPGAMTKAEKPAQPPLSSTVKATKIAGLGEQHRGNSIPRALAVARLIASSNFHCRLYGQVDRLRTLEDTINTSSRAVVLVSQIGTVGKEAAGGNKLSVRSVPYPTAIRCGTNWHSKILKK